MKSIFMCVNYPVNQPAIGLSKKIRAQIETFWNLGYKVTYSAYVDEGIAIFEDEIQVKVYTYSKYDTDRIKNLKRRFLLMDACADYLNNHKYALGYIRWDAVDKKYLRVLKNMRNNCKKVVMDTHGYFKKFTGTGLKGKYIVFCTKANGRQIKKYVDLIIAESTEKEIFGICVMKIDTGINIKQYSCHKYVGSKEELNLISVANETNYHGYDRIIRGIYNYKKDHGNTKAKLYLVGNIHSKTIKLIHKLQLEDQITLPGYQTGKSLELIYQQCNMGVGPLAPHRVGGKEGTGIKTKEYFAIGLPYVYAGQELIVPDDYPYVCCLADDETPIEIEKIVEFYERIRSDQEMQRNMRSFAEENFSWEKIYTNMLRYLELTS